MSDSTTVLLQALLNEVNAKHGLALTLAQVTYDAPTLINPTVVDLTAPVRNSQITLHAVTETGAKLSVNVQYNRLELDTLLSSRNTELTDTNQLTIGALLSELSTLAKVPLEVSDIVDEGIERGADVVTPVVIQAKPTSLGFFGETIISLLSGPVDLTALIAGVKPELLATEQIADTQGLVQWLNSTYDLNIAVGDIEQTPLTPTLTTGYDHQVLLKPKPGSTRYTGQGTIPFREGYQLVRGVTLIPSTGTVAYSTVPQRFFNNNTAAVGYSNVNNDANKPDVVLALEQLETALPLCDTVSVVVAWFGDDQRAGNCTLRPKLGVQGNASFFRWEPDNWSVAGLTPATAMLTSVVNGQNVYGSTPSDASIIQVIQYLKSKGKRVVFYPFILMDIQWGSGKPNPYWSGEQSANVWRGRVSCYPAPGVTIGSVVSPDGTAEAQAQIDTFFNNEWGFKRYINHYRDLCVTAGGVDAFLIGSEMVGITHVRGTAETFAAIPHLKELAAGVKAVMPTCQVSYAADWSEYHSKQYPGNILRFPLDDLWSDPNIDFVGIDNYLPIADVRDTDDGNLCHDVEYLKTQIEGGELYDYYYIDRTAGTKGAITDGSRNKPWVFRQKDIRGWWQNAHYPRANSVERATPTSWVPSSKPIWFTEFGCAAVDRGPNQPNVFLDPKSYESSLPYFSTGVADEKAQQAYIRAMVEYWTHHGGAMLHPDNMIAWTWDARPYPDFPNRTTVWGDGGNFPGGHWLAGRNPNFLFVPASEYPVISITGSESVSAGGTLHFTLNLDRPAAEALTVILTYGGTATAGTDYTSVATVAIAAGQTGAAFEIVTINPGTWGTATETVIVTIANGRSYKPATNGASATGSIVDNPVPAVPPVPVLTLGSTTGNQGEAVAIKAFKITLSQRTTIDLVVGIDYRSTATYGVDYTGPATVTIPAQTLEYNGVLNIIDDDIYEGNEGVQLVLKTGSGYTIGSPSGFTWTILDNDAKPTISVAGVNGGSEGGTAMFRVTANRQAKTAYAITATWGGTATKDTDYTVPATITMPAMATSVDVPVTLVDDSTYEVAETIIMTLSAATPYTVGTPASATATIATSDGTSPSPVSNPTITKTGTVGTAMSMVLGSATGTPDPTYTLVWDREQSTDTWVAVDSTNTTNYVPTQAGRHRVRQIFTNPFGTLTAISNAVDVV